MAGQVIGLFILMTPVLAEAQERHPWSGTRAGPFTEARDWEVRCRSHVDLSQRRHCSDDNRRKSGRFSSRQTSILDRLLLLVDEHRRMTFDDGLKPGTKLNFEIERINVSRLDADVKLTLKIEF